MTALSPEQEELCRQDRWDFSGLRAMFVHCTLKRSPDPSPTQGPPDISMHILRRKGVRVELVRAIDPDIDTGVGPDIGRHGGSGDCWTRVYAPPSRTQNNIQV